MLLCSYYGKPVFFSGGNWVGGAETHQLGGHWLGRARARASGGLGATVATTSKEGSKTALVIAM